MYSIDENGGCAGLHHIFIIVVDAAGNPLDGVTVYGIETQEYHVTGEKGPGKTEIVLWSRGDQVRVVSDGEGERSSELSRVLDTREWNIPIQDLIWGGYCSNEADCTTKINQNTMCNFHHSWEVVFQRQW